AHYRDIPADSLALAELPEGGFIKLIARTLPWAPCPLRGPGQANPPTQPLIPDIRAMPRRSVGVPIPATHQPRLYGLHGPPAADGRAVDPGHTVWYGAQGDTLHIAATQGDADGVRVLLLAGKPLNEPVVQYGPFVMNTTEEIEQALRDYRDGVLAQ